MRLCKPMEYTRTTLSNHLWVIIVYQGRFIPSKNCTTLVSDGDNGGGYACVGEGGIWEISLPTSQFCCKLKTSLKINKIFKKKFKTSPLTQWQ